MKLKTVFCSLALALVPLATYAQSSPYEAAVKINGAGVTYFEISQRALMLEALGTIGDVKAMARKALIEERLEQQAARKLGITLTDTQIETGQSEYAKRANLTPDQMIAEFAKVGVYKETFVDFVRAGLLWRQVVQQKFQSKAFITEAELDSAIALGTTSVGASVLLSELVLPLTPGQEAQTLKLADELYRRIRTQTEFKDAVLTYSASPSRADGGKVANWVPISNLPPQTATLMLTRGVGTITPPVKMQNSVAIFRLRGLRDNRTAEARTIAYDYATYLIPGGRTPANLQLAANLKARIDTCKDLAAEVRKQPENRFKRALVPIAKVPRKIAAELANLDNNEVSTKLTQGAKGDTLVFLMLCNRATALTAGNREDVRKALYSQRLTAFASGYLQELRGDAIIIDK